MALVKRIDTVDKLREEFEAMNRGNNFTDSGLEAILDLFNQDEEDTELDVIGLCVDFSEYTFNDFYNEYFEHVGRAIEELGYQSWDFLQGQEREDVVMTALDELGYYIVTIQADSDVIVLHM